MSPDILMVRDGECYRLLFGYLHLANALSTSSSVVVDVQGEGPVSVVKTREGLLVNKDSCQLPLLNA